MDPPNTAPRPPPPPPPPPLPRPSSSSNTGLGSESLISGNWSSGSAPEALTPAKLALGVLLREYWRLLHRGVDGDDEDEKEELGGDAVVNVRATFLPGQRKQFCLLALRLIQGNDLPADSLERRLRQRGFSRLASIWRKGISRAVDDGVGGLMDLAVSLENLLYGTTTTSQLLGESLVHRTSIVGLYLRRLVLQFNRLTFHEVSHLLQNFQSYFQTDKQVPNVGMGRLNGRKEVEDGLGEDKTGQFLHQQSEVYSRRQAEFYIAQQVELLQNCESLADSPASVDLHTSRILKGDSLLSGAHFLRYLNSLRLSEYSNAVDNLCLGTSETGSINDQQQNDMDSILNTTAGNSSEEANKGFRYASLKLACLHARFGHRDSAISALKESIKMAQEANDYVCLQHAMHWLFRMHNETADNQLKLMGNFIEKTNELGLTYLMGLGYQEQAKLMASLGMHPKKIWDTLMLCDLTSCRDNAKNASDELTSLSMAQRSCLWTLYGRGRLSLLSWQLLLWTASQGPNGGDPRWQQTAAVTSEAHVLALCAVARGLYDAGRGKQCDRVLDLASRLYRHPSTPLGRLVRSCRLEVSHASALHATDWAAAQAACDQLDDGHHDEELRLLLMRESLWKGRACEMGSRLARASPNQSIGKARVKLLEAEWFCLCGNFAGAIRPVISALRTCAKYHLEWLELIAQLHVAHIQLQLHRPKDALQVLSGLFPHILREQNRFEVGRAHLLMAKCLVAAENVQSDSCEDKRMATLKALRHLARAKEAFQDVQAHHRVKDVLYMMALLYNLLDMCRDRNQVSAEFKKLEEQHPTNVASRLPLML